MPPCPPITKQRRRVEGRTCLASQLGPGIPQLGSRLSIVHKRRMIRTVAMVEKQEDEDLSSLNSEKNCIQRLQAAMFKEKEVEIKTATEKVMELLQPVRYKPSSVDEMCRETKFTKAEVKFLYRAFKQECPNGIIDEERFKEVYENIFPLGDASKYAHLVFHSIDRENTGGITFGDFMEFLSVISKGSTEEKILWSFHFYDVDRNGCISREEMMKVTRLPL